MGATAGEGEAIYDWCAVCRVYVEWQPQRSVSTVNPCMKHLYGEPIHEAF